MTGDEFKAAIARLDMTQDGAGDWLNLSRRTINGYANDGHAIPEALAKLLRLMVRLKLKPKDVK